jgi:hypothetical protein
MIISDYYIDQIQNSKKSMVKMLVTNETMSSSMNKFIDSQTEYTKQFVSGFNQLTSEMTSEIMKSSRELSKFDLSKFLDSINSCFSIKTSKKS